MRIAKINVLSKRMLCLKLNRLVIHKAITYSMTVEKTIAKQMDKIICLANNYDASARY